MAYPGFLSMPFDPEQPGMLGGMGQTPGVLNGAGNQSAGLLGGLLGPGPHPIASALGDRSAALLGFGLPLLLSHWEKDAMPAAMAGLQGGQQMDFARRQAKDKQTREAQQQAALAKALQVYGIDAGFAADPDTARTLLAAQMKPQDVPNSRQEYLLAQQDPAYASFLDRNRQGTRQTPYTDPAKLKADLDAGFITPEQYQQAMTAGGDTGFFQGKAVDAQALNYLVSTGKLTKEEAAQIAAGRTVVGADGSQYFFRPQDLVGPSATVQSAPGGAAAPPPAPGAKPGPTQLSGPPISPQTRLQGQQAESAYNILTKEIDNYEALIQKYGVNVLPGTQERDLIGQSRRNLQLQLKELFNLGVLNGPDLDLMNQMIIDPSIEGNPMGIFNLQDRAKASLQQLRGQLKTIRDERMRAAGTAAAPPDGNAAKAALDAARSAIQRGADPEAVKQRLRENGIDPAGL